MGSMNASNVAKPHSGGIPSKSPMGRRLKKVKPVAGEKGHLSLNCPSELLHRVDEAAKLMQGVDPLRREVSRTDAVNHLLELALNDHYPQTKSTK